LREEGEVDRNPNPAGARVKRRGPPDRIEGRGIEQGTGGVDDGELGRLTRIVDAEADEDATLDALLASQPGIAEGGLDRGMDGFGIDR
jgi:hypothetical protein